MSAIHRSWIDSWDKTKKRILSGEVTEEQAARLVYQNKFRNTLGKKRQRNKAHVSGSKDDSKEKVVSQLCCLAGRNLKACRQLSLGAEVSALLDTP